MANYATSNIRTVALVGQGASGKTTLAEALLLKAGAIKDAGSVERGTTVSDFDPMEKTYQHSLRASVLHSRHRTRASTCRHARASRTSSARRSARSTRSRPRPSSSTRRPASR